MSAAPEELENIRTVLGAAGDHAHRGDCVVGCRSGPFRDAAELAGMGVHGGDQLLRHRLSDPRVSSSPGRSGMNPQHVVKRRPAESVTGTAGVAAAIARFAANDYIGGVLLLVA